MNSSLEENQDANPEIVVVEDERNPRPRYLVPFKVQEIGQLLRESRGKHKANSKSSSQDSSQSTYRSYRSRNYLAIKSKVDDKLKKQEKKYEEFNYQPKIRPDLPSYDHIIKKKIELDTAIRRRHQSLIDIMQINIPT